MEYKSIPTSQAEMLADHLVTYANKHGLWPTLDFIVQRWMDKNPEYFMMMKNAVADERNNLQDIYGTNEKTRKGNASLRRVCEVPERIYILIDKLFPVEKQQYVGGDKQFWRDFSKRYPVFSVGKL